ncbi:MAG: NAD(P)/FAD-dependent oxidoreductase [Deltaproteobacteria bacterium]|nr:NAD(P)/FAD-dependent oxidoreductase [Deltaproteobacteria bacterium]
MTKRSDQSGERDGRAGSSVDTEALRAKYREEREKRLRADAADQYVEIAGIHAHFERDPWVEGELSRAPVTDDVDVVLIGGGFGGLITGARLRQSGVQSLRIVEKGGDFGGTWYWNRYPGVACDVESFCYLPMMEEVGTKPTSKYPPGPEIFEHCRALARKFDLYRGALFRTEVNDLRWDESVSRWIVRTDRGDTLRARFVCMAVGFLEKPKLPGIPGIELFEGKAFHTSRWDYGYTGGDANGNLTGLRDKRVGVIGTGATAVQCVPHLGASAQQLFVFQRTPAGVGVRNNGPVDPEWAERLAPGWQKRRIENFQTLTCGGYEEEDLVADGWTDVPKRVHDAIVAATVATGQASLPPEEIAAIAERIDHEAMEEVRARIARVVRDPATAEALKPYYNQFCKRPCFHDEYLPTFNRPNVKLVDTKGRGVERITKKGVVVDGVEIELDCLVYATGFEVATEYVRRAGYETTGRGGLTISEKWRDGYRTFHGLHLHDFPNCFMMSLAQSGYTLNFPYMIDVQAQHIAYVIGEAMARGARTVEASEAAEDAWCAALAERAAHFDRTFAEQCTPSYYNNEGRPDVKSLDRNFFFGGPTEFAELLAAWRAEGTLQGLVLER